MAHPNECCQVHAEFSKRIDDRWNNHLDLHRQREDEICDKIELIFGMISSMERKLNWLVGAAAIAIPAMQLILHLINQRGHP